MRKLILLFLLLNACTLCMANTGMQFKVESNSPHRIFRSNEGNTASSAQKEVLNHDTWREKSKDYHFNPPRSVNQKSNAKSDWDFSWLKGPGKIILYIILFALLGIILYFLIRLAITPGNRRITSVDEITKPADDEPGIDSDLEKLLKEALGAKDFRTAIRIYYLLSLRELGENNLVSLSREKTNFEYLAELGNHPAFLLFREMTIAFERCWFGEGKATENSLTDYSGKYDQLKSILLSPSNHNRP